MGYEYGEELPAVFVEYLPDLAARVRTHNLGRGAKYTRSRLPVALVYSECFDGKSEAMRRECAFKRLTHAEKEALVSGAKEGMR